MIGFLLLHIPGFGAVAAALSSIYLPILTQALTGSLHTCDRVNIVEGVIHSLMNLGL